MNAAQSRLFSAGKRGPEPITVLSLGAGQESTALALMADDPEFRKRWMPGRRLCVMADTGDEHPETYENVERLRDLHRKRGEEFHFLKAGSRWHSESWPDLLTFYRRGDRIGSKSFPKSCSQQLKIAVVYRFLEELLATDYGVSQVGKRGFHEYTSLIGRKITMMIGLSAEEAERRLSKDDKAPKWMKETVDRVYPLIELGWTRGDCQEYIRAGLPSPLPVFVPALPIQGRAGHTQDEPRRSGGLHRVGGTREEQAGRPRAGLPGSGAGEEPRRLRSEHDAAASPREGGGEVRPSERCGSQRDEDGGPRRRLEVLSCDRSVPGSGFPHSPSRSGGESAPSESTVRPESRMAPTTGGT